MDLNILLKEDAGFNSLVNEILDDAIDFIRDEYDWKIEDFLHDESYGLNGMVNEYWNELRFFISQDEKQSLILYLESKIKIAPELIRENDED